MDNAPHIPVLRFGREYESLDQSEVKAYADDRVCAKLSRVNAGIMRRDLRTIEAKQKILSDFSMAQLFEICKDAARHFLESTLPLNEEGDTQSPDDYVRTLSATSGLPHVLCRANMNKVATVLDEMPGILAGLTRGLDPAVIDSGVGHQNGVPVCYAPAARALGAVLPSNSPGVNSIWIPAIALKVPILLKPGREEPWTPLRIIRALIEAGCPKEVFGFYPTDHEGSAAILQLCERSLLFGDEGTTRPYRDDPRVEIHGPGRSKVFLGEDEIDRWEEHLDVLVSSVSDNGGRSCINASAIFVPRHADEIARALAERLAQVVPLEPADPEARLSAFANPKFAAFIDQSIESGLDKGGATDLTAEIRGSDRAQAAFGGQYLLPTIVRCASHEHPLANTEYLFPFASVVEVPQEQMLGVMGPSLVVTAITKDPSFSQALIRSPHVERLNLGPWPTSRVEWDQPHEGNLFDFLYTRRAIQHAPQWN